jgi:ATP-dependent DNA ligase
MMRFRHRRSSSALWDRALRTPSAGCGRLRNLNFAGRVGIGFSDQLLRSLYSDLEKIRIEQCPFFNVPAVGRSRWDQGLTAAEMRRCYWVKPVMVCQVKFTEWTRDDRLRRPVFLGLREDKKASEVMGRRQPDLETWLTNSFRIVFTFWWRHSRHLVQF